MELMHNIIKHKPIFTMFIENRWVKSLIKGIMSGINYFDKYSILGTDDLIAVISVIITKFYFYVLACSIWIFILDFHTIIGSYFLAFIIFLSFYYLIMGITVNPHIKFSTSNTFFFIVIGNLSLNMLGNNTLILFIKTFSTYFLWIFFHDYRAIIFSFIQIFEVIEQDNYTLIEFIIFLFFNIFGPFIFHQILEYIKALINTYDKNINKNFTTLMQRQKLIFASMTHDLRNPICSQINTLEDLVQSKYIKRKDKKALEVANFSAKLQLNLINNILDFAKLESGKFDINLSIIDIKELIVQILNIENQLAIKKRLYLKFNIISCPNEEILGDPNRISQIIMNLVGNAIKFTSVGGIDFTLQWITDVKDLNDFIKKDESQIKKNNLNKVSSHKNIININFESFNELAEYSMEEIRNNSTIEKKINYYHRINQRILLNTEQKMHSVTNDRQQLLTPKINVIGNNFSDYYREYIEKINEKFSFTQEDIGKKPVNNHNRIRRIISNDNVLKLNNEGILVIHIKDTGIGMKETELGNLFQPFYQLQTEAKHQGTGLGLWITKQLVSSMGGLISVKSKLGEGTEFKVIIPMKVKMNQPIPFNSFKVLKSTLKNVNSKCLISLPSSETKFKKKEDSKSLSFILLTYNTQKEKIMIDDLFFGSNSHFKYNKDFVSYNYDKSIEVIKSNKNLINSIMLFSINQFASSLYFANQIREIEIARKSYHIPIIVIGTKEVKDHAKDYIQIGVKNFVYNIFSLKAIFKEFIRMIRQEIMVDQKSIKNLEQTMEDVHRNLEAGKLLPIQAKVLIIDDDVFSSDALKRMIEKAGSYSVTNIYNGKKAIESYESSYSDLSLIISDINLPDINGIQVCQKIREFEASNSLKKIPIIGLTGDISSETIKMALNAGMNEVCIKPLVKDKLIKLLDIYIKR